MSEYQYYEFRAVDRPLTAKEMAKVREYSTRATITPTSFVNEYEWGNFKGDEMEFLRKYFDAHVYVANWGTHRFAFRVSADVMDIHTINLYIDAEARDGQIIIDLISEDEGGYYDQEYDGDGWMMDLLPLREEILNGDMRPLYIAWLSVAGFAESDDETLEPPLPPGMKKLTPAQQRLVDSLRVDQDLLEVASQASEDLKDDNIEEEFRRWILCMSVEEKDRLLLATVCEQDRMIPIHLRAQFRKLHPKTAPTQVSTRTVGLLIEAAEQVTANRQKREAEAKERKLAQKKAEAEKKRAAYLVEFAKRGDQPWEQVEALVASKLPKGYEQAVSLLKDLRDVAVDAGAANQFRERVNSLVDRHAAKRTFVERVKKNAIVPPMSGV